MKTENQSKRRAQIEQAAYELLSEKGYKGSSMLAIAKRAGASNETLYKWYGSKQGLFGELVKTNAVEIETLLQDALDANGSALEVLETIGAKLLLMLTGNKAIALNRAAAVDASQSGELGAALVSQGRGRIAPLMGKIFAKAVQNQELSGPAPDIADVYLRLLIGDSQIRRVIGAIPEFSQDEADRRARFALNSLKKIYA